MDIASLVQEFAHQANLPKFLLDDRGMARVQLDGHIVIDFEYEPSRDVLHLYSSVQPAPPIGGEAQLRLLLEANLFQDRSLGTAFALDTNTGEFMACVRLELQMLDGSRLLQQVERMATAVEKIRIELDALNTPDSESQESRMTILSGGMLPG